LKEYTRKVEKKRKMIVHGPLPRKKPLFSCQTFQQELITVPT